MPHFGIPFDWQFPLEKYFTVSSLHAFRSVNYLGVFSTQEPEPRRAQGVIARLGPEIHCLPAAVVSIIL